MGYWAYFHTQNIGDNPVGTCSLFTNPHGIQHQGPCYGLQYSIALKIVCIGKASNLGEVGGYITGGMTCVTRVAHDFLA